MISYDYLIKRLDMGVGSAMAVLTFLMVFIVAFVFVKLLGASPEGVEQKEAKVKAA
jgi:multiple sugar transport system permease protein